MQTHCNSATAPTVATLRAIVERTVRWSPELKARAEKAALIAVFRPITHAADGSYTVPSECDTNKSYTVTAASCDCPDSTHARRGDLQAPVGRSVRSPARYRVRRGPGIAASLRRRRVRATVRGGLMAAPQPIERISITPKGLAVLERLERRSGRPAPQQPRSHGRRHRMSSNGHTAEVRTGLVQSVNDRGYRIDGQWLNRSKWAKLEQIDDVVPGHVSKSAWTAPASFGCSRGSRMAQPARVSLWMSPIAGSLPSKDMQIVRESCIKSAAAFCASRPELKSADLFCLAERMEAWVLREC